MVAMLSLSSVAPYMPDMPMQPSASGKSSWEPSLRGVVMRLNLRPLVSDGK